LFAKTLRSVGGLGPIQSAEETQSVSRQLKFDYKVIIFANDY
jgi:hypothetical protein